MKKIALLLTLMVLFGCIGPTPTPTPTPIPTPTPLPTPTIGPTIGAGEMESNASNLSGDISEIEGFGEDLESIYNMTISEEDLDVLANYS